MTADSRRTITAALEAAGWTDADHAPGLLPKLRHSSGPVLTVLTDNGGCALELRDGLSMTFLSGLPTAVVIAACLAASGQLDPSQERVELEERDYWLTCLENAGLDNWSGVDVAREMRAAYGN